MNSSNWPADSTADTPTSPASTPASPSYTPSAKNEAREVGREGAEAGAHVAQVAGDEAKNVAQEAGRQAKNLVGDLGDDLRTQAGAQQQKVAEGLRSISDELRGMADNNTQEAGTATRWVHEAARRAGDAAGWLDERDPGSLVDEVKRFARRRPGMFLAVAAGAGLLAGRMTRGLAGGSHDQDAGYGSRTGTTLPPAPRVAPPEAIKVPPTAEYHLTSGYPAGAGTPGTADAGLYESSASLETFADDDTTICYDPASGGVPPTVYPPLPEGPDGTEGRLP